MSTSELAQELGLALPAPIAELPDEQTRDLLDALRSARVAQTDELDRAITAALDHVPRPLRGAVRKAVGL